MRLNRITGLSIFLLFTVFFIGCGPKRIIVTVDGANPGQPDRLHSRLVEEQDTKLHGATGKFTSDNFSENNVFIISGNDNDEYDEPDDPGFKADSAKLNPNKKVSFSDGVRAVFNQLTEQMSDCNTNIKIDLNLISNITINNMGRVQFAEVVFAKEKQRDEVPMNQSLELFHCLEEIIKETAFPKTSKPVLNFKMPFKLKSNLN